MKEPIDIAKRLEMSEDEQYRYLWQNSILKDNEHLADLAFRLRDEAMKKDNTKKRFHDTLYEMQVLLDETMWATAWWGYAIAQPIHWILAALKAKEKKCTI